MSATLPRVVDLIRPLIRLDRTAFVASTAQLTRDLMMDSLDRQSLACELDEAFAIEIPDDDISTWCTVADVAETVDRLAPERPIVAQPNYANLGFAGADDAEGRN